MSPPREVHLRARREVHMRARREARWAAVREATARPWRRRRCPYHNARPDTARAQPAGGAGSLLVTRALDQGPRGFSALLFEKLGRSYDRELVCPGATLHDLGLLDAYMTSRPPFRR